SGGRAATFSLREKGVARPSLTSPSPSGTGPGRGYRFSPAQAFKTPPAAAASLGGMTQSASRNALLGILAGALVISAAMGVRQTFGLYLGPFAFERGLPVTLIAFAIALHNLVWGVAQPFAGAAADRHGSAPVVGFGAAAFAAGLALATAADSPVLLVLGVGVLVGIGVRRRRFGVGLA